MTRVLQHTGAMTSLLRQYIMDVVTVSLDTWTQPLTQSTTTTNDGHSPVIAMVIIHLSTQGKSDQ